MTIDNTNNELAKFSIYKKQNKYRLISEFLLENFVEFDEFCRRKYNEEKQENKGDK